MDKLTKLGDSLERLNNSTSYGKKTPMHDGQRKIKKCTTSIKIMARQHVILNMNKKQKKYDIIYNYIRQFIDENKFTKKTKIPSENFYAVNLN